MFGGRGWTIYELPEDPDSLLKLVFDSGDDFERLTCEFFPWAYNSILNEEYGPVSGPNSTFYDFIREDDPDVAEAMVANNDPAQNGCADQGDGTPGACPMEKTVDQASAAGGPQVENVQSGVVCGRLVALAATAEQSIAFLYDITNIKQPTLIKIFHLSPASKDRSAALAYNDGTLGDITPRNFFLLDSEDSPSGKPGVLISGVISGTLSFWEFECDDYSNGSLEEKSSAFGWQLALPFILGTTASILTSYLA